MSTYNKDGLSLVRYTSDNQSVSSSVKKNQSMNSSVTKMDQSGDGKFAVLLEVNQSKEKKKPYFLETNQSVELQNTCHSRTGHSVNEYNSDLSQTLLGSERFNCNNNNEQHRENTNVFFQFGQLSSTSETTTNHTDHERLTGGVIGDATNEMSTLVLQEDDSVHEDRLVYWLLVTLVVCNSKQLDNLIYSNFQFNRCFVVDIFIYI